MKTLVLAAMMLLLCPMVHAEDETGVLAVRQDQANTKGGKKKRFRPHFHGRIMFDAASYQPDQTPLGAGTNLSSARLSVSGRINPDWRYRLDYEWTSGKLKSAYITRHLGARRKLMLGNFQVPFSLEELTGSSSKTFMERALPNAFAPSYRLGLGLVYRHGGMSVSTAVFGDSLTQKKPGKSTSGNEGGGVATRWTYAPMQSKRRLFHLGLSGLVRFPNADGTVRFRSRPEAVLNASRLIDTKTIDDVDYYSGLAIESALVWGGLSLQGEYMRTVLQRGHVLSTRAFFGWYAYVSYFLTGESRPYRRGGTFGKVVPERQEGAWEIALRRSALDLSARDIWGGTEYNTTLALNYYLNPAMRLMTNYIMIDVKGKGVAAVRETPKAFLLRFQVVF